MPDDKNKRPSPNDQRSTVKNPNNPAHQVDRDNRSKQLDPNQTPKTGDKPVGR